MIIYNKNNNVILDLPVDDTSYRYRAIRQGDKVYLYFSLTKHVEIPIYSYIEFQGQRYTLWKPENLTKNGERNLEYTVEFGGWWELLNRTKYKFLSGKPHKLKFPLTAKPRMFMQLLVDNLNLHDTGWTLGACIDATEKAMAFSHETCMEVLNRFADEFNTEFEFVNKTINFGKVERFKDNPLPLSYGKGNGFKTGVGRQNQGEKAPVSVLYVQGGDRNIDSSKYGCSTLLLPKDQELEYQGRRYKTDVDGMFITRADRELSVYNEDGYDASDIYPSRVGEVTKVETEPGKDNDGNPITFYNIVDTTIPEALNYKDCRIPTEKATIIFQTGILTGKEFDIVQTEKDLTGYDHLTRTFKLTQLNADGTILPNANMFPAVGDKYAVFNITLPDAYTCDNVSKSGASWEMFREAVRYMYENEEENFTFTGELDGIWAKKHWLEIGGKLQPGSYILFSDAQFQAKGLPIRITAIKDYINKPHSPELELSNTPVAGFVSSELGKIEENEAKDEERHKDALSFTMRRWQDMVETGKMLEKAIDGFSASINPITISTMQIRLGAEQLQFRFVTSKTSPKETIPDFVMNNTTREFTAPSCILQHMSLGITTVSPTHTPNEYKFWNMSSYTSPYLGDDKSPYYLYAKCSKSGTTGTFELSKVPHKMEEDSYYYFLVGTLGTEWEKIRSFTTCYGFTEILPGRMIINLITSTDGNTYFNLAEGEIGGKLVLKAGSSGLSQLAEWAGVSKTISNTVNAANKAQDAADNAQSSANSAVSRLTTWASDSYISPTEKTALIQQKNEVMAEYQEISNQATLYNLTYTSNWSNYYSAYTSAISAFDKYTAFSPENIYVSSDYSRIAQYYTYRKYILNDIAKAAKKAVDDLASSFGDLAYLKEAISNETLSIGGLLLTSLLKLGVKSGSTWVEKAGINGTAKNDNDVIAWFGGTLTQAVNDLASIVFRLNGAGQVGGGAIKWYKENGIWNAEYEGIIRAKGIQLPFVNVENSDAIYSNGEYRLNGNLSITTYMNNIILPTDTKYNGSIVSIFNNAWPPFTKSFIGTYVRTQNGQRIFVPSTYTGLASDSDFVSSICVSSGVVRLIAVLGKTDNSSIQCIRWVVLK